MAFGDKQMSIKDFWDSGLLQEVNRRMLHPLGLALFVDAPDAADKDALVMGIFDCRDDAEGIVYGDSLTSEDTIRALLLQEEADARKETRKQALGFWIEPLPNAAEELGALRNPQ